MIARSLAAATARIVAAVMATGGCAPGDISRIPEASMQSPSLANRSHPSMQVLRSGSGRPLALIGGGLTGSASWQPHAERLATTRETARLQLLSVEYGLADRPLPDGYSVRLESAALAAALDDIGWEMPIDLVAWSYGAAVTLDFALNHPERVRTLTLIEPPALWVLPDHGRALPDVRELAALLPGVSDDVSIDTLLRFLRSAALVPPDAEPETLPQWESWVRHRRSLRNGDAVFRHDDDAARLRAFTAPVLLVTGTGTSTFLRAVIDTLAATLPDARVLELPGAHAPHLAALDEFLARVAAFQEAGPGGGPGRRHTVSSRDGTPIAFWQSGSGPALLLVHGATADHTTTWHSVHADLARRFTIYAMDRRGRGGSGDHPDYDLQREAEDVAAVVTAIGGPVHVLGHSYGALVALEAALHTPHINGLILYEGVPLQGAERYEPDTIARLEALLAAGDVEGMLTAMFRELLAMPIDEFERLRSRHEAWATRLRNATTLPRELRTESRYHFSADRFAGLRTPTLLLVGGDSPPRELASAQGVAAALPDARVVVMPAQQHAAMYMAPELFVREIVRFLEAVQRRH